MKMPQETSVSDNPTVQVIQTPNLLRLKVGGRFGGIDAAAIAKAEAALKSLSGNFTQWLNEELAKLEDARAQVHTDGLTTATAELLYLRAHDLKGLGATYEFPIVTRIAGSLCKLIDDDNKRHSAPMPSRPPSAPTSATTATRSAASWPRSWKSGSGPSRPDLTGLPCPVLQTGGITILTARDIERGSTALSAAQISVLTDVS
jgi:hypothetical protein